MNGLSWFLYFGDVFGNVSNVIVGAGVAWVIGLAIWYFAIATNNESTYRKEEKSEYPSRWFFAPPVLLFLFAGLVPSKETIYMIAASETAEMAITSEDGQEMINDVKNVIKLQLKKLQEPETKPTTE